METGKRTTGPLLGAIGLLLGLFLVSLPLMPAFFMRARGDNADLVYGAWYKAEKSWDKADYLNAIGGTFQALWMTVDSEARRALSKPFFRQSRILEEQGRLKEAIDACRSGAKLIGQYDMEGVAMYYCDELQMQYSKTPPAGMPATATPMTVP